MSKMLLVDDEKSIAEGLAITLEAEGFQDDYVTKPFSTRELVARIKAVLRRAPLVNVGGDEVPVEAAGVRVDRARHEVRVDGDPVELHRRSSNCWHFSWSMPAASSPAGDSSTRSGVATTSATARRSTSTFGDCAHAWNIKYR